MPDNPDPRTVCCIGGMSLDSTLRLSEPAVIGASNPVRSLETPGGVARNVAENLARLGMSCQLISIVGSDEAGRRILKDAADHGVETGLVQKSLSEPTGTCTRVIQPDGEVFVGFADTGICDLMDRGFIQNRWLQIGNATLVFADTSLPAESLSYLITGCREHGLMLVVDAASTSGARKLPLSLHGVDMLFCNTGEARAMLGDELARDVEGMARALCKRGAASTVVTAGADGLAFASGEGSVALSAAPARVVDVSGAGDALVAGALYGRLMDYDPATSLRIGLNAAAMTVASEGGTCAELTVEAVTRSLKL